MEKLLRKIIKEELSNLSEWDYNKATNTVYQPIFLRGIKENKLKVSVEGSPEHNSRYVKINDVTLTWETLENFVKTYKGISREDLVKKALENYGT